MIRDVFRKKEDTTKDTRSEQKFSREAQLLEAAAYPDREFPVDSARSELIRWQQDLDPELDRFRHALKSEQQVEGQWVPKIQIIGYDSKGEAVYEQVPPMMNDLGVERIISYLEPLMSRNLMNSNYSEERVFTYLRGTISIIILHLRENFHHYEIRKQDLGWIIRQIKNLAEPTLWRCWNNGERSHQNTMHKSIEARSETREQEKPKAIFGLRGL